MGGVVASIMGEIMKFQGVRKEEDRIMDLCEMHRNLLRAWTECRSCFFGMQEVLGLGQRCLQRGVDRAGRSQYGVGHRTT